MSTTEVVFYILSAATILSGWGVVSSRNVIHSALFLILALGGVAALYLMLTVEFLALAQLVIYGGAVIMLVLFALMLTRARERPQAVFGPNRPIALLAAAGLAAAFIGAIVATTWAEQVPRDAIEPVPFRALGDVLFSVWAVPFEIVSVVLLVALIGAILLATPEEEEE